MEMIFIILVGTPFEKESILMIYIGQEGVNLL